MWDMDEVWVGVSKVGVKPSHPSVFIGFLTNLLSFLSDKNVVIIEWSLSDLVWFPKSIPEWVHYGCQVILHPMFLVHFKLDCAMRFIQICLLNRDETRMILHFFYSCYRTQRKQNTLAGEVLMHVAEGSPIDYNFNFYRYDTAEFRRWRGS